MLRDHLDVGSWCELEGQSEDIKFVDVNEVMDANVLLEAHYPGAVALCWPGESFPRPPPNRGAGDKLGK